jgi:multidrug efflux pump subunit AcrA (membrane-fusion protein)
MSRRLIKTMVRWSVAGVVLLGAAGGGYLAYQRWAQPTLTVTDVAEAPVVEAFYATGTLLPEREYPIKSNVEGIVRDVLVDKGSRVKKGQQLAYVTVEEYELRFGQAQADLELKKSLADEATSPVLQEYDTRLQAATEQLDIADREMKRMADLKAASAASQADIDRASERRQTVWSLVQSIKAQKSTRKLELARDLTVAEKALAITLWTKELQTINSPIDGVVLDRPITAGTRVKNGDHLMQIANVLPDKLVMRASVDEGDKTKIREGAQIVDVSLSSYPGARFKGKVTRVYPKADPDRRTFEVDVAIDAAQVDPGFSAGMTGELAFVIAAKQKALVVPTQAVHAVLETRGGGEFAAAPAESPRPPTTRPDGLAAVDPPADGPGAIPAAALPADTPPGHTGTVWVVREGKLVKLPVVLGLRSIERTEILRGLGAKDRVVITPVDGLQQGQIVVARYLDPVTAAGMNKPAEGDAVFKGGAN